MANTLNSLTTGSGGVQIACVDTSGDLNIQSGGSTKIAVTSAGVAVTGLSKASLPTGSVLQVVSATYSTQTSTTSASYVDTGLTATITPTSATSKIFAVISMPNSERNGAVNCMLYLNLCRNGSQIVEAVKAIGYSGGSTGDFVFSTGFNYYDSPASTSALTYKVQFYTYAGNGTVTVQANSGASVLTLMEIAA
jgi:hypothetical protein